MSISSVVRPTNAAPDLVQSVVPNPTTITTGSNLGWFRRTASHVWNYTGQASAGAHRKAEHVIRTFPDYNKMTRDILTSTTAGISTLMLMGADGDGQSAAPKWIAGGLILAAATGIGIWNYRKPEKENAHLVEKKLNHVELTPAPIKSTPPVKTTDAIDFSNYPQKQDDPPYILFVEDDPDLLDGYQDFFAASDLSNVAIRFAGNYACLISILKNHGRPSIIVTDGDLDERFGKKSNGYVLFRKGFFDFGIPLILQTGNGAAQMQKKYADYHRAQELGLLHITKGSGALEKTEAALKHFVSQISDNQNKEAI